MIAATCRTDEHCVTCADQGVPMRVLRVDEDSGLALCEEVLSRPAPGRAHELVLVDLVGDVTPGDVLLVHAATAIARLDAMAGLA